MLRFLLLHKSYKCFWFLFLFFFWFSFLVYEIVCLQNRRCRCQSQYCSSFVSVCEVVSFVWQIVLSGSKWSLHSCHSISRTTNNTGFLFFFVLYFSDINFFEYCVYMQHALYTKWATEWIERQRYTMTLLLRLDGAFFNKHGVHLYPVLPVFSLDLLSADQQQHFDRSHRYSHHLTTVLTLIWIFSRRIMGTISIV